MKKSLFISAVLLFTSLLNAQPAFIKDSLDAYIIRGLGRWQLPGAAVCIVKDGNVVFSRGYGVLELGKPAKVDENTLFMIGSNTKAFTGTALAILENEGRLSMDDKVQKWLPDFSMKDPWIGKEINLTDIVTHRVGMETFQGDFMYWTSDLTADEVIDKFGKITPRYGFRTKYGYTNAGYGIAGKVIKAVTDTAWSLFLKNRIFDPLFMTRTLPLSDAYTKAENSAKPHTFVEDKMSVIQIKNIDNLAPAGSIGSSVNDLSHWVIAQLDSGKYNGKQVIPFRAIQRTRQPFTIVGRNRHPFNKTHFGLYGLGWALDDYAGREIVSHTGGVDGFVTSVTMIPEERLGIIVLTNSDQNLFYMSLKWEIMDAYLDLGYRDYDQLFYERYLRNRNKSLADHKAHMDTVSLQLKPDADLSAFTGRYVNDVYGYADIIRKDDHLILSLEHHSGLTGKLQSLGGSRFLCTYNDPTYGEVVFPFSISGGNVESFTLSVDDFIEFTTYEFVKINR